jgi:hypothetical protein
MCSLSPITSMTRSLLILNQVELLIKQSTVNLHCFISMTTPKLNSRPISTDSSENPKDEAKSDLYLISLLSRSFWLRSEKNIKGLILANWNKCKIWEFIIFKDNLVLSIWQTKRNNFYHILIVLIWHTWWRWISCRSYCCNLFTDHYFIK